MPSKHAITIIGAGPAGLFAAEILATAGHTVTIYDRKPSPGRKFLMAGRGELNLTHSEPLPQFLNRYATAKNWLTPIINDFTPENLRAWCEELGQETFIGSSGRVFPKSMKASPLLRAWLTRLESLGVTFMLNHEWTGWNVGKNLTFKNADGKIITVPSETTLLALGGASWPKLGSDGSWQKILDEKNIKLSPLRPANCGFTVEWSDIFRDKFSGSPLKSIALRYNGRNIPGEAMIAQSGIEGGAIYALSGPLRDAIEQKGEALLHIDLRPGLSLDALTDKLLAPRARSSFSTWMQKSLNLAPVATSLLREASKDVANLKPAELAKLIKSLPLRLTAPFPIDRAISSAGGIAQSALNDNLMLNVLPGVFAAGEMLDWEAPTGGYLLQGCFSTGYRAAQGILKWIGS